MLVHLIDGTFELFRYFLSSAAAFDQSAPEELRAVRGVVASVRCWRQHAQSCAEGTEASPSSRSRSSVAGGAWVVAMGLALAILAVTTGLPFPRVKRV